MSLRGLTLGVTKARTKITRMVKSNLRPSPILPKHKDDWAAVNRLRRVVEVVGYHEEFRAIISALLEWVVDPQWPIADPVGSLVAEAGLLAVEPIANGLLEADNEGRTGMILTVVRKMSKDARASLCSVLEEFASGARGASVREVAVAGLIEVREVAESASESGSSSRRE